MSCVPEDIWLSESDLSLKITYYPQYDFCSYQATDEKHKDLYCAMIATRICRLEKVEKTRYRCEECPLDAQDIVQGDTMILTPNSDSKLARVSKHITSQRRGTFWSNASTI